MWLLPHQRPAPSPGGYAACPKGASPLAPGVVAPLAKGESHCLQGAPYSLRSPFGPACGCYCAALRLLAALALRASLRLLLRFATFTRNQGRGSDDAN